MDITSIHTVILNGQGFLALKHVFDQRTVKNLALKHYSTLQNSIAFHSVATITNKLMA